MADDESIYILEVNGNPDIGPSAGFTRALGAAGIQYAEFVELLVRHAAATTGCRFDRMKSRSIHTRTRRGRAEA